VQRFPIGFSHVVFTPDDQRLVTAGLFLAQGLATWDATSGQMLGTFGTNLLAPGSGTGPFGPRGNSQLRFFRLTLSPDGKLVYAVAYDYGRFGVPGAVGCWNTTSGELQFSIHESSGTLQSLVCSPDGKHLAAYLHAAGMGMYADAGSRETGIAVWDALSGQRKYTLQVRSREMFGPRMAFSADGKRLAVFPGGRPSQPGATGQPDGPAGLRLWQVESGSETSPIPLDDVKAGSCQQVLFSPDSKVIALVLNGRQVSLLEASTGKLLRTLDSATAVHQVAFSRDGKLLAAGCGEPNEILGSTGDVKLWTVANGKLAKHFQGQRGYASEVRFSPDGKRLLSLNEVSMVLWTLPAE
jgi:WD40 repeat protein